LLDMICLPTTTRGVYYRIIRLTLPWDCFGFAVTWARNPPEALDVESALAVARRHDKPGA